MRTHEHIGVSVIFATSVTCAANHGIGDPWIYAASIAGGEAIDLVDHPLFHLVYRRNQPDAAQARRLILKGCFREGWRVTTQAEAARRYVGLLLHNIAALCAISLAAVTAALFIDLPPWVLIFIGGFLLHMLCDIFSDLWSVGHMDNWWWFVSRERFANLPGAFRHGARAQLIPIYVGVTALMIVALRGYGSLRSDQVTNLESARLWEWGAPILVLLGYTLMSGTATVLDARKYLRAVGKARFSSGLVRERSFAHALRRHHGWGVASTAVAVAAIVVGLSAAGASPAIVFLAAVVLVLAVSTFVHSTPGEVGGIYGVALALIVDVVLSDLGVVARWPGTWGYLMAAIAISAVLIGIIGTVALRGRILMSEAVFELDQVAHEGSDPLGISELGGTATQAYLGTTSRTGLGLGRPQMTIASAGVVEVTGGESVVVRAERLRLSIKERISPRSSEVAFLFLFGSRFAPEVTSTHHLLPPMPRTRVSGEGESDVTFADNDATWVGTTFPGVGCFEPRGSGLRKTVAEVVDNLNTRYAHIVTEIDVYPSDDHAGMVRVVGTTSERTSTKAYATIEAEVFAAAVAQELVALRQGFFSEPSCYRVVYDDVAIYESPVASDWLAKAVPDQAVTERLRVPGHDNVRAPITEAHVGRQLFTFAAEVSVTVLLAVLGLQDRTSHFFEHLLK